MLGDLRNRWPQLLAHLSSKTNHYRERALENFSRRQCLAPWLLFQRSSAGNLPRRAQTGLVFSWKSCQFTPWILIIYSWARGTKGKVIGCFGYQWIGEEIEAILCRSWSPMAPVSSFCVFFLWAWQLISKLKECVLRTLVDENVITPRL
jgi:hypothetical protein